MIFQKPIERAKAIELRKKGYSYNEIREIVSVSKSSLSLWLRSIGLTKRQKQKFTEKKRKNQLKACQAVRTKRIRITNRIINNAKKEIPKINKEQLWFIGTALYWAEGAKQKDNNVSQTVQIGNSDPNMIILMLRWFSEICKIPNDQINFRVAVHETVNIKKAENYWSGIIGVPVSKFKKPIIKRHKINTNRIIDKNYNGLLEIRINKSTNLNRKISGWIKGMCDNIAGSSNGRTWPFGG